MESKVFTASDYAGMSTDKYSFYFGYEEIDENEDWCFVVSNIETGDYIVRWSSKEIGATGDYPEIALLKGIGKFLNTL